MNLYGYMEEQVSHFQGLAIPLKHELGYQTLLHAWRERNLPDIHANKYKDVLNYESKRERERESIQIYVIWSIVYVYW